jgi:hypothetical protein
MLVSVKKFESSQFPGYLEMAGLLLSVRTDKSLCDGISYHPAVAGQITAFAQSAEQQKTP